MCEHKYQVLNSETTSFYSDDKQFIQEVTATFYCEKCLDITQREQRIGKGYLNVKNNNKQIEKIKPLGTVTHRSYC
ncbi:hypothetical protein IGM_01253 [Bacillus cereus HuB4-4]|uniref:Uncharacterized protein n=1 Tax=Bacillus cereus HuB4-4 TaxID=1053211 RepID=A0A9W5QY58_BACCE|nr:hypothetical protein [Bacillus cereus]EOP94821.1 hypothetical protein IGM_01253 [Bacillus cereus HuB4-4]